MKTDSIKSLSLDLSNGILDQDLLTTIEVNCVYEAEKLITKFKEIDLIDFKKGAQCHYKAAARHFLAKSSVSSNIVRNISIL